MKERSGLSVAIITYNEEKNIRDCIESVLDLADEILVLDSHSLDRTKEIACTYPNVRFEVHDFDGHVQQKNRAIEMTGGEWILSIDADERVTPELGSAIQDFIRQYPQAPGAKVRRLTIHMDREIRHSGWLNSRYRLIRHGNGFWAGENPHDEILLRDPASGKSLKGPVLAGELIHYSFRDLADQVDTINKFSSIVAFNRAGRGKRASILKMIVKPVSKFLEIYIFKAGFLDGVQGFIIAVSSAYSTFLKWAKLWEMYHTSIERPSNVRKDYKVQ